jgi:hypothetical protein
MTAFLLFRFFRSKGKMPWSVESVEKKGLDKPFLRGFRVWARKNKISAKKLKKGIDFPKGQSYNV